MTREQMERRVRQIEDELDGQADDGWISYPAVIEPDYDRARLRVTFADNTTEVFDLTQEA